VFCFCIKLGSEQHNDDREPNPKHECDDSAERAVGFVVVAKILRIPRKEYRNDQPRDGLNGAAPSDPAPLRLFAARPVAIKDRERQGDYYQQSRPARDLDHRFRHAAKPYEV
jgi:hypothetical protein